MSKKKKEKEKTSKKIIKKIVAIATGTVIKRVLDNKMGTESIRKRG